MPIPKNFRNFAAEIKIKTQYIPSTMAQVYFTNLRTHAGLNLQQKLENIIRRSGFEQLDLKDKYVAIKIHFGELGNMAYIRPNYAAGLIYAEEIGLGSRQYELVEI